MSYCTWCTRHHSCNIGDTCNVNELHYVTNTSLLTLGHKRTKVLFMTRPTNPGLFSLFIALHQTRASNGDTEKDTFTIKHRSLGLLTRLQYDLLGVNGLVKMLCNWKIFHSSLTKSTSGTKRRMKVLNLKYSFIKSLCSKSRLTFNAEPQYITAGHIVWSTLTTGEFKYSCPLS